jgi:N-acetylglucosaminyl-diphospho-decaprenol L-rhamnosyltransferase
VTADAAPAVSVVVASWNTREALARCLEAVRREVAALGEPGETWVIDDASGDGSAEMVALRFPEVRLVRHAVNGGYARAVNRGLREARGRAVLLLGADAALEPGALPTLLARLAALGPRYAAVAPQLRNEDGSVQMSCRSLPTPGNLLLDATGLWKLIPHSPILGRYRLSHWSHDDERDVEQPQMTCLLVRRAALDAIGPLDEAFTLYFNDVDWCRRARERGLRIRFCPEARAVHGYGRATAQLGGARRRLWREGLLRYYAKWYGGRRYAPFRALLYAASGLRLLPGAVGAAQPGRAADPGVAP